jgi:hypothetical protein
MNYQTIKRLQKENGFAYMQNLINSGAVWSMEGSMGREAMYLLESGACMLPKTVYRDYYGNRIPSRDELKAGTKGTYQNSVRYYSDLDYSIEVYDLTNDTEIL